MAVQDTTANIQSVGGVKRFLREVKIELKKVTWPTRQQLMAYTAVVFIAVVLVSLMVWILDATFAFLFQTFLRG